ncbi:hypothetical protein JVU11DRAFT_892 [Chiua virens]|nr:hypothetical protein JVU11DRAFT_892 [Chiua virens]
MGPLYATDAMGRRRAPTTQSICKWIADFLLADVQSTTGFVRGFKAALSYEHWAEMLV